MAIIGYRRVSTTGQRLDRQDLGTVDRVFEEQVSGKDRNRPELAACLAYLRDGDTLRCYEVSRLGRSLVDLLKIIEEVTSRGVVVEFVKEGLVLDPHTTDPMKRMQLHLFAMLAEYERGITADRRDEGIAKAKERGVYRGRAVAMKPEQVRIARQRRRDGVTVARLMQDYGVSKMTMHRALTGTGIYAGPAYC